MYDLHVDIKQIYLCLTYVFVIDIQQIDMYLINDILFYFYTCYLIFL